MSITEAINRKNSEEEDEIEIRLSDIILFLKKNRRRIIWGFVIGLCIGALYAFSKPNMYTTEVTVLPESQSKGAGLGSLGSLAGLAGINVDNINSQDAIRPPRESSKLYKTKGLSFEFRRGILVYLRIV